MSDDLFSRLWGAPEKSLAKAVLGALATYHAAKSRARVLRAHSRARRPYAARAVPPQYTVVDGVEYLWDSSANKWRATGEQQV